MREKHYDVAVIGAGAAGMSAAAVTAGNGLKTAVIDREEFAGGILLQCIHNGFGLHHFHEELTGPEYAARVIRQGVEAGAELMLNTTVSEVANLDDGRKRLLCLSRDLGVFYLYTRSVVLAMGCRERNRGNLGIPGMRPAGVFTAGLAQRLLNIDGYLPGNEAVIIGSGDIGLIMARRLSWVGIKVKAVVEIMPYPSGLTRNIVQCLEDFGIPLYLSHSVTRINGHDRVESVDVAPLADGIPDPERAFRIDCDTILLSVGLMPENELSKKAGVELNHATGGPYVDARQMTNVEGVFACGNVLHVHDLVDYVSGEAAMAGRQVVEYLHGRQEEKTQNQASAGANLRYVVPNRFIPGRDAHFYMRSMVVEEKAVLDIRLDGEIILSRPLRYVKPAEMLSIDLPAKATAQAAPGQSLTFSLNAREV